MNEYSKFLKYLLGSRKINSKLDKFTHVKTGQNSKTKNDFHCHVYLLR